MVPKHSQEVITAFERQSSIGVDDRGKVWFDQRRFKGVRFSQPKENLREKLLIFDETMFDEYEKSSMSMQSSPFTNILREDHVSKIFVNFFS